MKIFARRARLEAGWENDVSVAIAEGVITEIETGAAPSDDATSVDTLLPALGNLHSHSFQRAMAGLTEYRARGRESFWTWRELMYRFLDRLTPEHVQAIAAQTFVEMQKAGYASVGEFHYVHHQPGGVAYDNIAELSLRVIEAAKLTGIGLTHLPVLYTYGGLGNLPLAGGQLRFGNSVDEFSNLVASAKHALADLPGDARIGIAPHSLRATNPADMAQALENHPDGPIHIHISEQTKEVEDVSASMGERPVEWLLANAPVNERWCLIHATHMTEAETVGFAKTGAVAGLCPITEANLGDGIFNGPTFLQSGGAFGVGSDSNVNISLTEELRTLEYSQRLRDRERNVMLNGEGSTGEALYLGAALGSAQALQRDAGRIAAGALADLIAIDSTDLTLCALKDEQLLDGLVFAAKDNVVTDVWSAGRHQVQRGHHVAEADVANAYRKAVAELTA